MTDLTVHRHGDRWAVVEQGAESPIKEFPTREAAEMAAREMAGGGNVEVLDEEPTGLGQTEPAEPGEAQTQGPEPPMRGADEPARSRQAGL
jgi:hypothetical protein